MFISLFKPNQRILKYNISNIFIFSTFMEDKHRIAIVNPEKCKPKKCKQECKKSCPVNNT